MSPETHSQLKNDIWEICNLLRGPYKRNEYRRVILPLTVLKRFDSILSKTKKKVLDKHKKVKGKTEKVVQHSLTSITKYPFYNLSRLDFVKLLDDPDQVGPNLISYVNGFSKNVRSIMERFEFADEIKKMAEKDILYNVIKEFNTIDLSLEKVDNMQMGYVFEELIRIGAEQSNEEAGEHFTPREVIQLMVDILLVQEEDLGTSKIVKKIYDPACGTGGMLSTAEKRIKDLNSEADVHLYGQDWNDGAWAVCQADILIKGNEPDKIKLGCSFTKDGFKDDQFDYMLANPPFGVSWKQQEVFVKKEQKLGHSGRFGAGLPRVNDGSLLFLQHMMSKMIQPDRGGSRIGVVFNGSPLFTGDAGSGESDIRQYIIENDWLEAVIALPDQLFYNTGISTYIWIVTNKKEEKRRGKVQLIDAREFWVKMQKSLGNKRKLISDGRKNTPNYLQSIVKIYGDFQNDAKSKIVKNGTDKSIIVSKIFNNEEFGYSKIVVERPLKLSFQITPEGVDRLRGLSAFTLLTKSNKKKERDKQADIEAGRNRQSSILDTISHLSPDKIYKDRREFLSDLRSIDKKTGVRLSSSEIKAVIAAFSTKDEMAAECTNNKGEIEADSDLRESENVCLTESIEDYMKREVLPYVSDAWIDESKTKIGYDIPLTKHFYKYIPPREIKDIDSDIKKLESNILKLLKEITNDDNQQKI